MPKILLVGSTGQLGQTMRNLLSKQCDCELFCPSRSELDILDEAKVATYCLNHCFDIIINCVAFTDVEGAESDRDAAFLLNDQAVQYLAKNVNKATLIHFSTDYVFSGTQNIPYCESDMASPLSVYGESKLASELFLQDKSINAFVIRTSWLYNINMKCNFIYKMKQLAVERDELSVVYDQVGSLTNVFDLASFVVNCLLPCQPDGCEILHYSNEGVCSWYDVAVEVIDHFGFSTKLKPVLSSQLKLSAQRPHYSVLSKERIRDMYDISVPHWRTSLKAALSTI